MVYLNVGRGSMYPPVVHHRTAFEFDERKYIVHTDFNRLYGLAQIKNRFTAIKVMD